jgi:hypothetical protein
MSIRALTGRVIATAARFPSALLLLLAPAFVGCENPVEPIERSAPAPITAPAVSDSHTLLLLPFNDNLTGQAGEHPTEASGPTFEPGVLGSAVLLEGSDRLAYGTAGNFRAAAGTIEFWIKPRWNGDDHTGHYFFTLGDEFAVAKDGADNLRFVFRADDSEAYQAYNVASWTANEWHHIAVTWTIPGVLKTYVDAVAVISHPSSAQDLITAIPAEMLIGSRNGYPERPDAVIDELRISDIARTAQEIAASYTAGTLLALAVQPITAEPFKTWRQPAKLIAATTSGTREYPPSAAQWSSSRPEVATVNANGVIKAVKAGRTTIKARIGGVQGKVELRVKAPVLPPKVERIQPYLATPPANSVFEIPVVILRYLPTADGANLDLSVSPAFGSLDPISLPAMKRRLDTFDIQVKFMLEEGSKFRGYQDPAAAPSIGYRVVAYITVYEPTPPGKVVSQAAGFPVYWPDYHQILERFNGRHFVEDLGVREFWLWQSHFDPTMPSYDPSIHKPEVFRGLWESNMSSRLTGDISNSDRDPDDMPVYSRTYVLYGQNIWRSEREAVHNRGHQLEAILTHANIRQDGNPGLFWQKFVGQLGRCGWTHKPPNTTVDYDYRTNYNPVPSDIADWSPEGIGRRKVVTAYTWGNHAYAWPLGTMPSSQEDRNEAHWYIYWMQSMPGWGNTVPYGRNVMTNWWRFTGNWDGSIKAGSGLYASCSRPITTDAAVISVKVLAGQVAALAAQRKLNPAAAHLLAVKLESAAGLLAGNRPKAGANALRAFADRLTTLVQSGRLSPRDGRTLLAGVRCLVRRLEGS